MSEYTDELVSQHLTRFPRLATAYLEDPGFHYEVNVLRAVLDDVEVALKQCGIGRSDAERVLCAVMMRRDEIQTVHLERTSVMQRELAQRFAVVMDLPVELFIGAEDSQ